MSDCDVIIIGAGAAGLSAAKVLQARGLSCLVVEASHRIGGRAYSEKLDKTWFDLGCSYMHEGAINPMVKVAEDYGFALGDGERFQQGKTHVRTGAADSAALDKVIKSFDDSLKDQDQDMSLADLVNWDDPLTPVFAFLMATLNASDLDKHSVKDYLRVKFGLDYPVIEGYGQLIAKWGADVPVQLNTPATAIHRSKQGVEVITPKGTLRAQKAIITVSVGILSSHQIRFTPELPDSHQKAIENLPCGVLNKIGVEFAQGSFNSDMAGWSVGWPDLKDKPINDGEIAAIDVNLNGAAPQAIVFAGGGFGEYLEKQGDAAMKDYARGAIRQLFGDDVVKRITAMTATAWASEPMTLGSYSYALPHGHLARDTLHEAIDETLYFAGEAVSLKHFSTCHGAYLSGMETANHIANGMGQ